MEKLTIFFISICNLKKNQKIMVVPFFQTMIVRSLPMTAAFSTAKSTSMALRKNIPMKSRLPTTFFNAFVMTAVNIANAGAE